MSMGGPKPGTWHFHSDTDSRWNCSGRSYVGGFVMPSECKDKLEVLKVKLGDPPEDLTWGYMKD